MKQLVAVAVIAILVLCSCKQTKNDYQKITSDPLLFCQLVHELNTVVMGNNFSPIVASRNYMYASVAAYEAIAGGNPKKFNSLAGQLNGLTALPLPTSTGKIDFNFSALLAFTKVGEAVTFPAGSMQEYLDSIKQMVTEHGMPAEVMDSSVAFADTIAASIIKWSKKDNYAQTRSASKYTVTEEEGRWVPTPPAYTSAMEPHWREIRTVVLDSANQFTPPVPLTFNMKDKNSPYYKEVLAVMNAGDSLTVEQRHIANFWDDNPFKLNVSGHVMFGTKKFSPPGHWMSIVGIASEKAKFDFPSTVYAYVASSIALFDAFIQCWDEKYRHNTVRPETVINKFLNPDWQPLLQTPPFPEYTCGHSTGSAAVAEALTSVFGENFAYTDTTELEFGIASRSFKSFRDAAVENNWARFYGGIHFHHSCIISTEYGKKVGELVAEKVKFKK